MLAKNANLKIIPVINKIDLPTADIDSAYEQMTDALEVLDEPILASAKEGIGINEIVDSVIANIPAPQGKKEEPLSAIIFDSFYDSYKGVIIIIRVFGSGISTTSCQNQAYLSHTSRKLRSIKSLKRKKRNKHK